MRVCVCVCAFNKYIMSLYVFNKVTHHVCVCVCVCV